MGWAVASWCYRYIMAMSFSTWFIKELYLVNGSMEFTNLIRLSNLSLSQRRLKAREV